MRPKIVPLALILLFSLRAASGQEAPKVAGTDVPAPKRTKLVRPEYPPEAQAKGIRGIVILELIIDTNGKVTGVEVVRSVPGLDAAAAAAARQWEYEVTKVAGKPVSVKLTVPITFAMKVPEVERQEGIPELRQGRSPEYPPTDKHDTASVIAQVTLGPDGHISEVSLQRGAPPYSTALELALQSWVFAPDAPGVTISFRVEADFTPPSKGSRGNVVVHLSGLQRSESAPSEVRAPTSTPSVAPAPPSEPTPAAAPAAPPPTAPNPPPPAAPVPAPSPTSRAEAPHPASDRAAQPPTESLSAPPPVAAPAPPRPPEAGLSSVRDVTLGPGYPDLVKGRRPVPPPLARVTGTSGVVEVHFSVDTAGITSVQKTEGVEMLKSEAEQAVSTWVFQRTSVERLHLVAIFTYQGDRASAIVKNDE